MKQKKKAAKGGNTKKLLPKRSRKVIDGMAKASHLHKNGNLQQAKILYKKIIRQSPLHHEALHMLGVLYAQTGNVDAAVDLMRKSIKADPAQPTYHYNLARAYHTQNMFDQAIAAYLEYLLLVPDDTQALHYIGIAFHDNKQLDQAINLSFSKGPGSFHSVCSGYPCF